MKLNYLTYTFIAFFSLSLCSFAFIEPGINQVQDETDRTALFDNQTDFVGNDGYVLIEFQLSKALGINEQKEVDELSYENSERIEIEIIGLTAKVKIVANLSTSNVWAKVFSTMGISHYSFGSGPNQANQSFDAFSNYFNLQ